MFGSRLPFQPLVVESIAKIIDDLVESCEALRPHLPSEGRARTTV
jgi:hypothetical protein